MPRKPLIPDHMLPPIPQHLSLPPCYCGEAAHFTTATRTVNGNLVPYYGVACAKNHKIPIAFSTPESALRFWSEHLI